MNWWNDRNTKKINNFKWNESYDIKKHLYRFEPPPGLYNEEFDKITITKQYHSEDEDLIHQQQFKNYSVKLKKINKFKKSKSKKKSKSTNDSDEDSDENESLMNIASITYNRSKKRKRQTNSEGINSKRRRLD